MPAGNGYIEVTVKFAKEGKKWTAECIELGTATFGDTFDEAQKAIQELLTFHLNALEDIGMRHAFFKKHGITFYEGRPRNVPKDVSVGLNEIVQRRAELIPA